MDLNVLQTTKEFKKPLYGNRNGIFFFSSVIATSTHNVRNSKTLRPCSVHKTSFFIFPLLSLSLVSQTYYPILSTVGGHKVHTNIFQPYLMLIEILIIFSVFLFWKMFTKNGQVLSVDSLIIGIIYIICGCLAAISEVKYQNISKIYAKQFNDVDNLILKVILIATTETYVLKYLAWGIFTGMVMIVSGIVFVLSSRNLSNKPQ